ncbi:MAG: MBOAT family protein [Firmicutes bacterium]|nr:MBOAT family protein [Bacillota bacterium]
MLFSSIPFLYYFQPPVLLLYLAAPKKLKNAVLLAASLFFYGWGERHLVLLFALSVLMGWAIGLAMEKTEKKSLRRALLLCAVFYDLGLLVYFKYTDFIIEIVSGITGLGLSLPGIALPIGISFYTFQLLSYDIDVYRRTVPAQKDPIAFGAYVAMFPQLIAGPIVRYKDIAAGLHDRTHSLEKVAYGIRRFSVGLAKKTLIANVLGELTVAFRQTAQPSVLFYWLYAVAYALQIYYDFSGYSDMAIGLGSVFGFTFMENFDHPYASGSITEFWRRWHISLGSWFRDYVYIPLGGNRKGLSRQLCNILTVWMLTGLWHGASWNFVVWGLLYAVLLIIEKLGLKRWLDGHKAFGHGYVLLCTLIGFVIFNAADLSQAGADLLGLISFGRLPLYTAESLYQLRSYGVVLLLAMLGAGTFASNALLRLRSCKSVNDVLCALEPAVPAALLLAVTAYLVDGSFNPFLYFRF